MRSIQTINGAAPTLQFIHSIDARHAEAFLEAIIPPFPAGQASLHFPKFSFGGIHPSPKCRF